MQKTYYTAAIKLDPPSLQISEHAWVDGGPYATAVLGPLESHWLTAATVEAADALLAALGYDRLNDWYPQTTPNMPFSVGIVRKVVR